MALKQQPKGQPWQDETGTAIPYNRTSKAERLRETKAFQLAKNALAINKSLTQFKEAVHATCAEVVDAIRSENGIKTDGKGNVTWYNFDRSIKIEVDVKEAIRFDEVLIEGARLQLVALVENHISVDDFIKGLVNDAFTTTAGKLDTSRLLSLKRHTKRIKDEAIKAQWDNAMMLIDQSITRPASKAYQRIWLRNAAGEYEAINLNFSSI